MDAWVSKRVSASGSGCWEWLGHKSGAGYGRTSVSGRKGADAHRVVYERLVGPIPEGLVLDHLCRVRHCVNPDHLEPVTFAENCRRGSEPTKTHCKNGHEFSDINTRQRGHTRICRACERESQRRYKARKRAAA